MDLPTPRPISTPKFSPYVFCLSPNRTDAVTRDRPVAVRERRKSKNENALDNSACANFDD